MQYICRIIENDAFHFIVFFFSSTHAVLEMKRETHREKERGNSDIPGISKFGCERTDTINTRINHCGVGETCNFTHLKQSITWIHRFCAIEAR